MTLVKTYQVRRISSLSRRHMYVTRHCCYQALPAVCVFFNFLLFLLLPRVLQQSKEEEKYMKCL